MNKNKENDFNPSLTLQDIVNDLVAREEKGVREYGANVDRRDLNFRAWLRHLYEKLLDGAMYARRALNEHDGRGYQQRIIACHDNGEKLLVFAIPPDEVEAFINDPRAYGDYVLDTDAPVYIYDEAFITAPLSDYKFPSNVFRDWGDPSVVEYNYRAIDAYDGEVNYFRIKPEFDGDRWGFRFDTHQSNWLSIGYIDPEFSKKIAHKSLEVRPGIKE